MPSALLFADFSSFIHLQLADSVINWLTPVWIIGAGAVLGLLICLALWGLGNLLSRVPFLGTLAEQPLGRWAAVGVLGLVYLAIILPLFVSWGDTATNLAGTIAAWGVGCLLAAMGSVAIVSRKTNPE